MLNSLPALMLIEVVDSVHRHQLLDEAQSQHLVELCLERIEHSLSAQSIFAVPLHGMEMLARFVSAEQASRIAFELLEAIHQIPPLCGYRPSIRIGLHHGFWRDGQETLGQPLLHTAARITALANSGQILASDLFIKALASLPTPHIQTRAFRELTEPDGTTLRIHCITSVADTQSAKSIQPTQTGQRLFITHHSQRYTMTEDSEPLHLGRDNQNQIVITDRRASRQHARIEYSSDGFIYSDKSRNGSFIQLDGEGEIVLRQQTIKLSGRGKIGFGGSSQDTQNDSVSFEIF